MTKRRNRPLRTCLGCGVRDDQSRLIRLRADPQGELVADDSPFGRGGYLHPRSECWDKFLRRKSVYRAFHVEIGKPAKEALIRTLKERHGE